MTEETSVQQRRSITTPKLRWGVCLLIVAVAGWALLNYTPVQFETPEELLGVDSYSPADLQKALAESDTRLYWQNSLVQFGFVGFCFGAFMLLTSVGSGTRTQWGSVILGFVSGIACGLLAVVAGTYLRRYLDGDIPLPLLDEGSRQLVTDVGVFVLTSVVLVLPICLALLFGGGDQRAQNILLVLLAALVAGSVAPLVASAAFPAVPTNVFPPAGRELTAIWLALLAGLVFVFTTSTGPRSSRTKPSGLEETA